MSLPRYREYKESGAPWLGRVPNGWEISPLKHLAEFLNGCVFKPGSWSESGVPIVRIENLNGSLNFNFFDGEIDERHHVSKGDLLFGWSGNRGTSFGPFKWKLNGLYFLNQHIFKVQSLGCNASWLYWCLRAVTAHVEDQATGIIGMVHVTKGDLGAIKVPVPSISEQLDIAVFLDSETAKIDALIIEQEKLIALLAEKRQATISYAVTKGVIPNAPMKDSGVAWLGEVPAHWEVTQLKRLCNRITDGAHISPETEGGTYSFVSTKDLDGDSIDFENCLLTSPSSFDYLQRTGCRPAAGDVLFSKDGTIGRTVVVRDGREFVVASSLIIITPSVGMLDSDFLNYLCKSSIISGQVEGFVKGAGLPRLSIQNLLKVVGVFPPIDEQSAISAYLKVETRKFDVLSAAAERAVALLKERRAALITAAVTGQVDVRGAVSHAPTERLEAIAA